MKGLNSKDFLGATVMKGLMCVVKQVVPGNQLRGAERQLPRANQLPP